MLIRCIIPRVLRPACGTQSHSGSYMKTRDPNHWPMGHVTAKRSGVPVSVLVCCGEIECTRTERRGMRVLLMRGLSMHICFISKGRRDALHMLGGHSECYRLMPSMLDLDMHVLDYRQLTVWKVTESGY